MDLVIEGPDGLEVVDWKTDSVSASEVERRVERYRLQAGLYVAGLEAATRRKVARGDLRLRRFRPRGVSGRAKRARRSSARPCLAASLRLD